MPRLTSITTGPRAAPNPGPAAPGLSGYCRVAVAALVATLPLSGWGCGRTACFQYSQQEYDQHGASCPAQKNALANFSDPHCPGPVASVDSEGSFDGQLCCYTVTQQAIDPVLGGDCFGGVGGFGGGFGGGSVGFGGAGVTAIATSVTISSSTGFFDAGGPSCFTCAEEANGTSTDPSQLCPSAATFWDALTSCACGSGPCASACGDSFCIGLNSSAMSTCMLCLADMSSAGCGVALNSCLGN